MDGTKSFEAQPGVAAAGVDWSRCAITTRTDLAASVLTGLNGSGSNDTLILVLSILASTLTQGELWEFRLVHPTWRWVLKDLFRGIETGRIPGILDLRLRLLRRPALPSVHMTVRRGEKGEFLLRWSDETFDNDPRSRGSLQAVCSSDPHLTVHTLDILGLDCVKGFAGNLLANNHRVASDAALDPMYQRAHFRLRLATQGLTHGCVAGIASREGAVSRLFPIPMHYERLSQEIVALGSPHWTSIRARCPKIDGRGHWFLNPSTGAYFRHEVPLAGLCVIGSTPTSLTVRGSVRHNLRMSTFKIVELAWDACEPETVHTTVVYERTDGRKIPAPTRRYNQPHAVLCRDGKCLFVNPALDGEPPVLLSNDGGKNPIGHPFPVVEEREDADMDNVELTEEDLDFRITRVDRMLPLVGPYVLICSQTHKRAPFHVGVAYVVDTRTAAVVSGSLAHTDMEDLGPHLHVLPKDGEPEFYDPPAPEEERE
jgi:hypothetical protein